MCFFKLEFKPGVGGGFLRAFASQKGPGKGLPVVLFCVAAAVNPFTNLLVAAAPVVMLASCITIAGPTAHASLVDLKVVEAICDAAAAKSAAGTRVAA